MSNRNEAWEELLREARQVPDELPDRVERTICRAARRGQHRWLRPLAGLAGAAAAFVLLVNSSVGFALAASRVPVVRELVQAVALDPSLKAAVEHDYVQLVGETYERDGVMLTVEYLIADPMNLSVFYSLSDAQDRKLELVPNLLDADGEHLPVSTTYGEEGIDPAAEEEKGLLNTVFDVLRLDKPGKKLYTWKLHATEEGVIQTQMQLRVEVRDRTAWEQAMPDPFDGQILNASDMPGALFTIDVPLTIEPQFLHSVRVMPVHQTVDVLGQKLTIDEIAVYPSNTRISWHTDPQNDAWLTYLPFYLTDEDGNRVDGIANGISAIGGDRDEGGGTIWLESAWYDTAEHLTVHLDDAAAVPKDTAPVLLHAGGTLENLPGYMEQLGLPDGEEEDGFCVRVQKGTYHTNTAPFDGFVDQDGQKGTFGSISTMVGYETQTDPNSFVNVYPMPQDVQYPLSLVLSFAPGQKLERAIEIKV